MISLFLPERPRQNAATVQTLGHPAAGVIGWWDTQNTLGGVSITQETALNYAAVWCATRILAETIASLPRILYSRLDNGGKQRATRDALWPIIHGAPNDEMSGYTYWEMQTQYTVNAGNSYAEIERLGSSAVMALHPIVPSRVTPLRSREGAVEYRVETDGGPRFIEAANMLHIPGSLSPDGITGRGVITQARESLGGIAAADRYGAAFFGNQARPSGILTHPKRPDKESREHLRREFEDIHQGPDKTAKVAILPDGMGYTPIGMSNDDAQFLQTRTFGINEVARWYRVPAHMLSELSRSTFSNIEMQSLEFVIYSLTPWLVRFEQGLQKVIPRAQRTNMFVEFLVDGLLRGDIKTRHEAYKSAIEAGWMNRNEARILENRNPEDGLDRFLVPLNYGIVGDDGAVLELQQNMANAYQLAIKEAAEIPIRIRRACKRGAKSIAEAAQLAMGEAGQNYASIIRTIREERALIVRDMDDAATRVSVSMTQAGDGVVQNMRETGDSIVDKLVSGVAEAHEHQRSVAYESMRLSVSDDLMRMIGVEQTAAIRAAKKQQRGEEPFLAWLDTFYAKHASRVAGAIRKHVGSCLVLVGRGAETEETVARLVSEHVERSRADLLSAADGDAAGFVERVEEVVSKWDESRCITEVM